MSPISKSRNPVLQTFFALVVIGSPLPTARAQFIQQGNKLVGTDAVGSFVYQGYSVALSADGNTAIVGGLGDSGKGAAWVYTRSGGVWSQQGNKLVGTGAVGSSVYQGCSVALSADGNTAIVGGEGDSAFEGAAWVYTRASGVWNQQGSKLVGTGAEGESQQGDSVALSADGNTAIVGGLFDNGGAGAAWVYTRSSGIWRQQGNKLVGTGAEGESLQGDSVALSADGNTAIVGGLFANGKAGAAWVYTRSAGVWSQQGNKLVGTGAAGSAYQGDSVALSADGNTAIVGGSEDNGGAGAVWVYTRTGGVWSQQGSKLVGTGAAGRASQGRSVALSADGNTAIVGGWVDNGYHGAAWLYARAYGVWSQQGSKLVGRGAVDFSEFQGAFQGFSVALSADGDTAIVGGPWDNFLADQSGDVSDVGAAWVFVNPLAVSPVPSILTDGTGVINGGSYLPGNVVSGSWVSIMGVGFTDQTVDWSSFDFSNGLLPTTLNGVQVLFNGQPAAVWYLIAGTPQQINTQVPANLSGNVSVQVIRNGFASNTVSTTAVQVAPAIFAYTLDDGKTFYPSAIFPDSTRLGDPSIFPGARKAKAGDKVVLFGNSLAPSPAGVVTVNGTTHPVTVTIGLATFAADFSGLVSPGVFQINITVPGLPISGNYPITIHIDGQSSQAGLLFPYTN